MPIIQFPMRLNKYLSNAGIASRRKADELIKQGKVKINGKKVDEMGIQVNADDKVQFENKTVDLEKKQYIILNKPKDIICTLDDPQNRRTVKDLVKNACEERVYPVGRLDRDSTGVLLLTNDGELSTKLMHPSSNIKKIYRVFLDRPLTKKDLEQLIKGVDLEDCNQKADQVAYLEGSKKEVGVQLHSGKNRVVRRMFKSLNYDVEKLDRVDFAGLTKGNLSRGQFRHLREREINKIRKIAGLQPIKPKLK